MSASTPRAMAQGSDEAKATVTGMALVTLMAPATLDRHRLPPDRSRFSGNRVPRRQRPRRPLPQGRIGSFHSRSEPSTATSSGAAIDGWYEWTPRSPAAWHPGAGSGPRRAMRRGSGLDRAEQSCQSCLLGIDLAISDDRSAQGLGRVVQPGLHRGDGCDADLGDIGKGKPGVVVQDEDRAVLRRETLECTVEGVTVVDRD